MTCKTVSFKPIISTLPIYYIVCICIYKWGKFEKSVHLSQKSIHFRNRKMCKFEKSVHMYCIIVSMYRKVTTYNFMNTAVYIVVIAKVWGNHQKSVHISQKSIHFLYLRIFIIDLHKVVPVYRLCIYIRYTPFYELTQAITRCILTFDNRYKVII